MGTRPDVLIGNYPEGNLVANILAHELGVTVIGAMTYGVLYRPLAEKVPTE